MISNDSDREAEQVRRYRVGKRDSSFGKRLEKRERRVAASINLGRKSAGW